MDRLICLISLSTLAALTVQCAVAPIACADDSGKADIFATPDAGLPPSFPGRNRPADFKDPLFGPGGDPPTREAIRAIPSITGTQLQQLDKLIFGNRDAITPLQEQVTGLRQILNQRKKEHNAPIVSDSLPPTAPDIMGGPAMAGREMMGAPDSMMAPPEAEAQLQAMTYQPDQVIQGRIDALNRQITQLRNGLWPSIKAILTPDQLNQLFAMRHGELMITGNTDTDAPDPQAAPKAGIAPPPAQLNRRPWPPRNP